MLLTEYKEDWSPTLYISPCIFQCFYLISMQRTIGLSQQLLKLQLPFSGNCQKQLRLDSNLLFHIVLICSLNNFLWYSAFVLSSGSSSVARVSLTFFLPLSSSYLYLVKFSFQAYRIKLRDFQIHKRYHANKLLFSNSHLLQFTQYFQWGYCNLALYIVAPLSFLERNISHPRGSNTIDVFVCLTLSMLGETSCLYNYCVNKIA